MLNNLTEIGDRIKAKRKELGYKQQEFAYKIKIDKSSLSRYEKGIQAPSLETIVSLANGLETSIDYLVFGNGDKSVKKVSNNNRNNQKYYDTLKSLVHLLEENLIDIEEVQGIDMLLLNMIKSPSLIKFINEATHLTSCKNRIDEKSYNKGVEEIISLYINNIYDDQKKLSGDSAYYYEKEMDEDFENNMAELKETMRKR